MKHDALLTALSNLADATRMAEGPGLLSSYERAEHLRIVADATDAADEGDYQRCADLLSKLDGPLVRRLEKLAQTLADNANEEADQRRIERYYGSSSRFAGGGL